jgi:tellurite resistance protein TerC
VISETCLWIIFGIIFTGALCLDLFVFQRKAHVIPIKEAFKLVAFWVSLALLFAVVVYFVRGPEQWDEYLTAYVVEYSLSIDNLFVFMAIFTYFAVPREAQRSVLLWGIIGAIIFRGIFIFAGITLVSKFHFLLYILGALLLYTSFRLFTEKEKEVKPDKNPVVRFARKIIRVDPQYDGNRFFKRINGLLYATPLLIVLITIETTDIMFATDSVPAVFGITLDPFIVYTSNLFAILGLRALFFAISGMFHLFRFLVYGLCVVLAFVGIKMLISDWYQIPTLISLAAIGTIIVGSIIISLLFPAKNKNGDITG